jgi:hypothetical protein
MFYTSLEGGIDMFYRLFVLELHKSLMVVGVIEVTYHQLKRGKRL